MMAAVAQNGAIGYNNQLLWHLPEDLKRFKAITLGYPMIMGRKTFESLPGILPKRLHIVISRKMVSDHPMVVVCANIEQAILKAQNLGPKAFVIGGGEIYAQMLPHVSQIELTHVDTIPDKADAFFPTLDPAVWTPIRSIDHSKDEQHPMDYCFTTYVHKSTSSDVGG